MEKPDLIATARLERERAQKAQYTAMMLREWAASTRERHRALREEVGLMLRLSPPREPRPGWNDLLAVVEPSIA